MSGVAASPLAPLRVRSTPNTIASAARTSFRLLRDSVGSGRFRIAVEIVITLTRQADGDLGARMLAAITRANTCVLVIGSDCPALTPDHLRTAAEVLRHHADVVVIPAEDGGYALIGMRTPEPALFSDVPWSTPGVMDETRRRLRTLGLTWHEPTTLWDVDLPHDLERMRAIGLHDLIPSGDA